MLSDTQVKRGELCAELCPGRCTRGGFPWFGTCLRSVKVVKRKRIIVSFDTFRHFWQINDTQAEPPNRVQMVDDSTVNDDTASNDDS